MRSPITRRDALSRALGSSMFFGLSSWALLLEDGVAQQDRGSALADAKERALRLMKRQRRHGVALIVPSDAKARRRFVEHLTKLFPTQADARTPLVRHFLEHVWIVVEESRIERDRDETVVFLDPDGKRVGGAELSIGDKKALTQGLQKLLDGRKRLERRAASVRPELVKAIEELGTAEGWSNVYGRLSQDFDLAAPAIFSTLDKTENKSLRDRLHLLVRHVYTTRVRSKTEFPYGVRWKLDMHFPEPCPPCGMARPTLRGRKFIGFLTKKK